MVLVRARILILSAIILASVATGTAGAQGLPGWLTKQFSIERIDADRVRLIREVEIEGEANTPQAGQKFFADDLQMNIKTGELIAEGNVVFQTPTARISADSVVFNTKTSRGTFTNASGIAQLGERGERNRRDTPGRDRRGPGPTRAGRRRGASDRGGRGGSGGGQAA